MRSSSYPAVITTKPFFASERNIDMADHPDVERLRELFINTFAEQTNGDPGYLTQRFDQELNQPNTDWILLYDGPELFGFMIIEELQDSSSVFFRQCCIPSEFLHKNVVNDLFRVTVETYPDMKRCHLLIQEGHEKGLALGQAFGFQPSSFTHPKFDPKVFQGYTLQI